MALNSTDSREISRGHERERFRDDGREGKILHVLGGEKLGGTPLNQAKMLATLIDQELDRDPTLMALGKAGYDNKIDLLAELDSKVLKVTVGVADNQSVIVDIPVDKLVVPMRMFPEQIVTFIDPKAASRAGLSDVTNVLRKLS
jgi:hypothetical protein